MMEDNLERLKRYRELIIDHDKALIDDVIAELSMLRGQVEFLEGREQVVKDYVTAGFRELKDKLNTKLIRDNEKIHDPLAGSDTYDILVGSRPKGDGVWAVDDQVKPANDYLENPPVDADGVR